MRIRWSAKSRLSYTRPRYDPSIPGREFRALRSVQNRCGKGIMANVSNRKDSRSPKPKQPLKSLRPSRAAGESRHFQLIPISLAHPPFLSSPFLGLSSITRVWWGRPPAQTALPRTTCNGNANAYSLCFRGGGRSCGYFPVG